MIAWDKQGLNPSADDLSNKTINGGKLGDYGFVPLLKALPAAEDGIVGSGAYYTPNAVTSTSSPLRTRTVGNLP